MDLDERRLHIALLRSEANWKGGFWLRQNELQKQRWINCKLVFFLWCGRVVSLIIFYFQFRYCSSTFTQNVNYFPYFYLEDEGNKYIED